MTWKPVVVAVLSCALLAACSGSTSSDGTSAASVDHPAVATAPTLPLDLDGGALVVDAATVAPSGREIAARVLAGTFIAAGPQVPVLGHVHIEVPKGGDRRAVVQVDLPTAWVYVMTPPKTVGITLPCPHWGLTGQTPSPVVPADASGKYAVIVDATTGHGYLYFGAGTPGCSGEAAVPSVDDAQLQLSVPYVVKKFTEKSARLTVTVPACGSFESFTPSFLVAGERRGMATAHVPSGACAGQSTTVVQSISGRFVDSPHSPPGLVCGDAYDAGLGRPADCVA